MSARAVATRGLISLAPAVGLATWGLIDSMRTPAPSPPSPPMKKRRGSRTVQQPENEDEYLDEDILAENAEIEAQAELADLSAWGQLLADILADAVSVEVQALETRVVIDSVTAAATLARADTGAAVGHLDTAADEASPPGIDVTVDIFDVVDDSGDDD